MEKTALLFLLVKEGSWVEESGRKTRKGKSGSIKRHQGRRIAFIKENNQKKDGGCWRGCLGKGLEKGKKVKGGEELMK